MDFLFGMDKPGAVMDGVEILTTVHGNVELSVVRSILEGEEIPYRLRDRGAGGVTRIVTGDSPYGCDVLVPKEWYEKALEILDAYRTGEPIEEDPAEETEE